MQQLNEPTQPSIPPWTAKK